MTLEQDIVRERQMITLTITVGGIVLAPGSADSVAKVANPNGIPACHGYLLRKEIGTKDPVCDLRVNFVPDWIVDGMAATVDVGYNGATLRRFTGTIQNIQHGITQHTIECHGTMWLLIRQLDAPDIDVTGLTVNEAIIQRLQFVGLTNYSVDVSTYELGTVVPAMLPAGQTLDQVTQLLDINDGQLYELGNGQIIAKGEMYFLPAPTAFKRFSTSTAGAEQRILDGSDHEDPDYFRDHIIAFGASIPDGDPDDPDTTFTPLKGEVTIIGSTVRQPPAPAGVFATQEFQQDLIDTPAEIDDYAAKKGIKLSRIPRDLSVEQVGNPFLELGMTLYYEIPEARVASRWFVKGLTEEVSNRGYRITLDVTGGTRFGGTIAQNPVAAFTYTSIQQMIGGVLMQIVTLDGSGSHAGDGAITAWDWSGDVTGSGERLVFSFDPDDFPDGPEVTLTVTATNGLTGDQTQSINKDPENAGATPIAQPAVFYSADSSLGASPDSGATWNDILAAAGRGVDCKPPDGVTPAGIAVHGDGDTLVRTNDFDGSSAVVFAGGQGNILYVWWDKVVGTNCWASTDTGAILRSIDDGATFTVYRAPTGYPVYWLATPVGPQPSIWAGGGRGDQPETLVQYNIVGSPTWTPIPMGGGEMDLTGATVDLTCVAAASRLAGELVVGFAGEMTAANTNVFRTLSVFNPAAWLKAIGLDGKQEVRFVVPDFPPGVFHVGYDEESVWNTDDGLTYTETPNVFPAGYTPNQCLWEGDVLGGLDGIFLTAVEDAGGNGGIMKNTSGFLAASDWFRGAGLGAWPVPAKCKSIAIGSGGTRATAAPRIVIVHDSGGANPWSVSYGSGGGWSTTNLDASVTSERPRPWCQSSLRWFVSQVGGFPNPTSQSSGTECDRAAQVTQDGGGTWGPTTVGDETCTTERAETGDEVNGLARFAFDAGGRIWAARKLGSTTAHPIRSEVLWSDDGTDASWTSATVLSVASGSRVPMALLTHPLNQNVICLISTLRNAPAVADNRVLVHMTEDRGGSWTTRGATVASGGNFALSTDGQAVRAMMLPNGRLVIFHRAPGEALKIWTSDDKGETWTLRHTTTGTQPTHTMALAVQGQWDNAGVRLIALQVPTVNGSTADFALLISEDSGTTWGLTAIALPADAEAQNDYDAIYDGTRIVLVSGSDVFGESVQAFAPVDATGVWTDLTGSLPIGSAVMGWEGTALIP